MKEELLYYAGSRDMSDEVRTYLKEREEEWTGTFFRGMMFPKHLIKKGTVIEEWHGSSHWSRDKNIALMFALASKEGYVNEDYEDALEEELGVGNYEFVQMVMTISKLKGVALDKTLEELGADDFSHEKEITTLGVDFIIADVEIATEIGEVLYIVSCEAVA